MTRLARAASPLALALALAALPAAPGLAQDSGDPAAPKDAILILDASGSMWGQIEGVNKIVIAKDVVEQLVRSLPEQQRLGFVAYGHRQKGDCGDIQTLADVGAARDDVINQLRSLNPRGMTPLTDSVMHAAEELNYTQNAASVILVSDGLETCDADPCALARTLEENGLDFTVHVVGFDVTEEERAGLQCIADETGGDFLSADNADELTEALTQVAVLEGDPEPSDGGGDPVPSTLALKATILSGGPLINSDLDWTVTPAAGGDAVFTAEDAGSVDTEILPGDYVVEAVWSGWRDGTPKTGSTEFTVNPQQPKVITLPIDLGLPVTLEAPAETPEGQAFAVTWSGPDDLGASIEVARPDDSWSDTIYFFNPARARATYESEAEDPATLDTDGDGDFDTDDEATAMLGAPSVAGEYEVRYILGDPKIFMARVPLTVTDSPYAVSAPEAVAASTEVQVDWEGPLTDGDFVTIIEAGSEKAFENGVTAGLTEGEPATITAPAEPGEYEVRYVLRNGYTTYGGMQYAPQASTPLTVTEVSADLSAPDEAVGGSTIRVTFEGPEGWEDDYVSIVEPGAVSSNRDSRVGFRRAPEPGVVDIRVPVIGGAYELVYFLQPGDRPISRIPITIIQPEATVDAPDTVKAGESFTVAYSGDAFGGDRVVVVPADRADTGMFNVTVRYGFDAEPGGTEGTVTDYPIAAGPGEYEVRYVTGLQHQVIARDTFTVVE